LGDVPHRDDERKKREFDPTMHMLRECIAEAEKDKATDEYKRGSIARRLR
jgi:hypothetical protein